jgi:lipopolysaccharide/colanic/teichoic acid biosynthesis glycosyltransferase
MIERLRPMIPHIERRLAGKPGLTGLAQIEAGYCNDVSGMRLKLAHDLRYLRRQSLWGDMVLVAKTLPLFWDRSAL